MRTFLSSMSSTPQPHLLIVVKNILLDIYPRSWPSFLTPGFCPCVIFEYSVVSVEFQPIWTWLLWTFHTLSCFLPFMPLTLPLFWLHLCSSPPTFMLLLSLFCFPSSIDIFLESISLLYQSTLIACRCSPLTVLLFEDKSFAMSLFTVCQSYHTVDAKHLFSQWMNKWTEEGVNALW